MTEKNSEAKDLESLDSLTDDQIVTERKLPRCSFLGATGALLTGAAGMIVGVRASAPRTRLKAIPTRSQPIRTNLLPPAECKILSITSY